MKIDKKSDQNDIAVQKIRAKTAKKYGTSDIKNTEQVTSSSQSFPKFLNHFSSFSEHRKFSLSFSGKWWYLTDGRAL